MLKLLQASGVVLFLALALPCAGWAWESPDPDASLAHFPSKVLKDASNILIPRNVPAFFVGTMGVVYDLGAYGSRNALGPDLVALNAKPLFDLGNFYGEGWVEGGAALGSWTLGAVTEDAKLQCFGRDAASSLILSTVLVTGLKVAVNRTRPDGGAYSFPSGHSITAFCVAPVVQKYWGWEAGIPAYLAATVTGLARMESNRHYLSDVIAGATLGIVIGNSVVHSPEDLALSAGPDGMELRWTFN